MTAKIMYHHDYATEEIENVESYRLEENVLVLSVRLPSTSKLDPLGRLTEELYPMNNILRVVFE